MERVIRFILHLMPPTPQRLLDADKFYLILWKKKRIKAETRRPQLPSGLPTNRIFRRDIGRRQREKAFSPFSLWKSLIMIESDLFETSRRKI